MRNALRFIVDIDVVRRAFGVLSFAVAALLVPPVDRVLAAPAKIALAHRPVTTSQPDAQREFDTGLTLMYAFNPEEATFHFQEAARIDPQLALAYWGIALAAGPNVNTEYDLARAAIGRAAVAQARALDARASTVEKALVDALGKRYEVANTAQILGAETAYANAMGDVARRFPNDLDVQTLYAESLMDLTPLDMWHPDGSPNRYTRQVIGLLGGVLKRDPDALGANHYFIHTYEYSTTPQAALESARRLARLTYPPGAEHLAHMPAHIFIRVGDYDGAIAASLGAIALFGTYLGNEHSDVHNGYFHHDLQVLDYAYAMSGQWAKARDTATQIADQANDNGAAAETYLMFHRYRELLALQPPAQPGLRWRFAQGMAAAGTGDRDGARATLAWIDSLHDGDPRTGIARALLAASLDAADRREDAGIANLRRAVALQDGLRIKEPPAWYYSIRETLGARLALVHRYPEAQRVFDDDLRRNPQNPRSLFGLSQVLRKTDPKRAPAAAAAFAHAWRHADVSLTLQDL
jgi:tetratricopeptide (TPR) repeat protein